MLEIIIFAFFVSVMVFAIVIVIDSLINCIRTEYNRIETSDYEHVVKQEEERKGFYSLSDS